VVVAASSVSDFRVTDRLTDTANIRKNSQHLMHLMQPKNDVKCWLKLFINVVTTTARLTASTHVYDHMTPLLNDLHWLRAPEHIQSKLCVLTYRCLSRSAPQCLSELLQQFKAKTEIFINLTTGCAVLTPLCRQ